MPATQAFFNLLIWLWIYDRAIFIGVVSWTGYTNISPGISLNIIIPTTCDDTVISVLPLDNIIARCPQDQIVLSGGDAIF